MNVTLFLILLAVVGLITWSAGMDLLSTIQGENHGGNEEKATDSNG